MIDVDLRGAGHGTEFESSAMVERDRCDIRTQGLPAQNGGLKGKLCMGAPLDRFNSDMTGMSANGENKIVLDLEEMPMIDSSGIGPQCGT